jgi:LysR family transcriptional regulator, transcriptional activator AphB
MKSNYSLDDLRYFCVVAQLGSFNKAALSLSIPLSTLSRRIRQLEEDLQLRLLNRDAHRISLTHTGELYFERSKALFDELSEIDEDLHNEKHQPKGKIRISAPINAGAQFLRTILYEFLLLNPDIHLDLRFSNSLIDIESEGMDLVFRVGNPVVENWVCRPLKHIHFILCASPSCERKNITHPMDLCGHPMIVCHPMSTWQLVHTETGQEFDYQPNKGIRLEVDEVQMLTHGVKAGLGIGYIPDYFAIPMVESGELTRVLPEWSSKARTLSMLYRDRHNLPLRVRMLLEFVIERFELMNK